MLHLQLFDRSRTAITLTEAGKNAYEHTTAMFRASERLLRVLGQDRFNVSELTAILGLAQSGVSRHLGLLKEAGLVAEQRELGFVYYRLADEASSRV